MYLNTHIGTLILWQTFSFICLISCLEEIALCDKASFAYISFKLSMYRFCSGWWVIKWYLSTYRKLRPEIIIYLFSLILHVKCNPLIIHKTLSCLESPPPTTSCRKSAFVLQPSLHFVLVSARTQRMSALTSLCN